MLNLNCVIAGYNIVEINASDDRSIDAFKLALENATQMKSVLDQQHRPNCLILGKNTSHKSFILSMH